MLYLLLLIPLAVVVLWSSVRVNNATELAYFIGFFVFSAGAGLVFGYMRWVSAVERFYLTMLAAYVGASPRRLAWPPRKRRRSRSWR
jgi:hypothetical protein